MLMNVSPMCWFLFLLLSLTLAPPNAHVFSFLQIMIHHLHLPSTHLQMAHPLNPGSCFGSDLMIEGVEKELLSLIALPLPAPKTLLDLRFHRFRVSIKILEPTFDHFILTSGVFSLHFIRSWEAENLKARVSFKEIEMAADPCSHMDGNGNDSVDEKITFSLLAKGDCVIYAVGLHLPIGLGSSISGHFLLLLKMFILMVWRHLLVIL